MLFKVSESFRETVNIFAASQVNVSNSNLLIKKSNFFFHSDI